MGGDHNLLKKESQSVCFCLLFDWSPDESLWSPQEFFLRLRWDSKRTIAGVGLPMLFLSSKRDEIVPASQMQELHDAAVRGLNRFRCFRKCCPEQSLMCTPLTPPPPLSKNTKT